MSRVPSERVKIGLKLSLKALFQLHLQLASKKDEGASLIAHRNCTTDGVAPLRRSFLLLSPPFQFPVNHGPDWRASPDYHSEWADLNACWHPVKLSQSRQNMHRVAPSRLYSGCCITIILYKSIMIPPILVFVLFCSMSFHCLHLERAANSFVFEVLLCT